MSWPLRIPVTPTANRDVESGKFYTLGLPPFGLKILLVPFGNHSVQSRDK